MKMEELRYLDSVLVYKLYVYTCFIIILRPIFTTCYRFKINTWRVATDKNVRRHNLRSLVVSVPKDCFKLNLAFHKYLFYCFSSLLLS